MTVILTLRKTIPSGSHNAPFSMELGNHWPAGQQFKLPGKSKQRRLSQFYCVREGHTVVEQIGGEEVLVSIPDHQFPELFGIEVAA